MLRLNLLMAKGTGTKQALEDARIWVDGFFGADELPEKLTDAV